MTSKINFSSSFLASKSQNGRAIVNSKGKGPNLKASVKSTKAKSTNPWIRASNPASSIHPGEQFQFVKPLPKKAAKIADPLKNASNPASSIHPGEQFEFVKPLPKKAAKIADPLKNASNPASSIHPGEQFEFVKPLPKKAAKIADPLKNASNPASSIHPGEQFQFVKPLPKEAAKITDPLKNASTPAVRIHPGEKLEFVKPLPKTAAKISRPKWTCPAWLMPSKNGALSKPTGLRNTMHRDRSKPGIQIALERMKQALRTEKRSYVPGFQEAAESLVARSSSTRTKVAENLESSIQAIQITRQPNCDELKKKLTEFIESCRKYEVCNFDDITSVIQDIHIAVQTKIDSIPKVSLGNETELADLQLKVVSCLTEMNETQAKSLKEMQDTALQMRTDFEETVRLLQEENKVCQSSFQDFAQKVGEKISHLSTLLAGKGSKKKSIRTVVTKPKQVLDGQFKVPYPRPLIRKRKNSPKIGTLRKAGVEAKQRPKVASNFNITALDMFEDYQNFKKEHVVQETSKCDVTLQVQNEEVQCLNLQGTVLDFIDLGSDDEDLDKTLIEE